MSKPRMLCEQGINQFQPKYSPDGKWIAYVTWCDSTGGALWKIPASGGKPKQLSVASGRYELPTWSPDGQLIAAISTRSFDLGGRDNPGAGQLVLLPVSGGPMRVIDENVWFWNQLQFTADGGRIIYKPEAGRPLIDGKYRAMLVSRDLAGGNEQIVAAGAGLSEDYILMRSISPDRRFLVYSMNEDLYLVPLVGQAAPFTIYDKHHRALAIRFASGVDPNWEQGGKVLSWSYGNKFFSIDPEKIAETAILRKPAQHGSSLPDSDVVSCKVRPDHAIPLAFKVPDFYAHGTIALTNARIITMHGDQVIDHGTILIKDGKFTTVGTTVAVPIPKGIKVLDLAGATVIPGLIDLHLHMHNPPDIFPQQSWMFLVNLAYGVTTARDPQETLDSFGYTELLESGGMTGPRYYSVGRSTQPLYGQRINNLEDAESIINKRKMFGATVIKQYMSPTRLQRQWILMACEKADLNMTNEGYYDPILQLAMIKDGSTGIEHNPIWGSIFNDVLTFKAMSGTYHTPVLQAAYGVEAGNSYFDYKYWRQPELKLLRFAPKIELDYLKNPVLPKDTIHPEFLIPARIDLALYKRGVHLVLGSHGDMEGVCVPSEIWAMQMGGLTNMQALQAATIEGARGLGVQKDLGSIEKGKIADLVILNKNPLDDIHNTKEIRYVMKDGVLYDTNTQDEIWPVKKKGPSWKLSKKLEPRTDTKKDASTGDDD